VRKNFGPGPGPGPGKKNNSGPGPGQKKKFGPGITLLISTFNASIEYWFPYSYNL
jgi:hypothetical protein